MPFPSKVTCYDDDVTDKEETFEEEGPVNRNSTAVSSKSRQ